MEQIVGFSQIIGQSDAMDRIQSMLRNDRLPHALLFSGPDGVGKRTVAIALAQLLLCSSPTEQTDADGRKISQACGKCADCKMFLSGSHADLHTVYKELAKYHDDAAVRDRKMQDMGIDVIRDFLIKPAAMTPARGRGKVFIILEAELMNDQAQNCLLKTLEEPPPGVTIILICQQTDQLLPTILSRCGLVRFSLLPKDFVAKKLVEAEIEPQQAAFWAAFTDGSIGRAKDMTTLDVYPLKRLMLDSLAKASSAASAEFSDKLAKTMDELSDRIVSSAKKSLGVELAKTVANRTAGGIMLELIASAYGDAMTGVVSGSYQVNCDQPDVVTALAARFDPEQLAKIIEHLSDYEAILWRNVNHKLVWDNVAITCATGCGTSL